HKAKIVGVLRPVLGSEKKQGEKAAISEHERKKQIQEILNKIKKLREEEIRKQREAEKKKKEILSRIPRRMRRFYRDKKIEEIAKEIAPQIKPEIEVPPEEELFPLMHKEYEKSEIAKRMAQQELERFMRKYGRHPRGSEYDEIAENIFEQIKDAEVKGEVPLEKIREKKQE
ncbi:MAG: hypothetical protein J7L14_03980, partial [Candidatus Diapherotrites archaeon]|nr:hypothetical protein [Candidatus Diapherotrites archaeon]